MKRSRSFVLISILIVSATAANAQTVTLRYRWTKGETRTYKMTTQSNSEIVGMPGAPGAGTLTVAQGMTQTLKFTAEDVAADGTATLRQTFQSIRMESDGPMGKMLVDTAVPDPSPGGAAPPMRRVLDALAGESVTIAIAPDGTIRKVDGASRIADKIARLTADDPAAGAAGQAIRRMLTEEALKNTLEQTFSPLSAGPVTVGGAWTGRLSMGNEAIGRVVGTPTFTLKALEGAADAPVARVAVNLTLKQEVKPVPSGPAGMVTTLRDNKGEGEILFDAGKGHIQRSTMRTEVSSSVTMNGPDGVPTTMQNKTTTTMTMELIQQ